MFALKEYKTNLSGLNELEAKLKFVQLCRSLKTYGVTFFLVKEKMKGKNRLVARLLGVTKESVVRVDEKSKEFLNVYPLECVKKWAASPNTFTLDFGDHFKEPYYSVQTTEGEHIARLISGYIDIILKKASLKTFSETIKTYIIWLKLEKSKRVHKSSGRRRSASSRGSGFPF